MTSALRGAFLVAVVVAAAVAFRGHEAEVVAAVTATPPAAVLGALGLVVCGLLVTAVAWLDLLRGFGHRLPGRAGPEVFFLGQLGKYVPGGVWSIGAHAHLARDHGVPARVTAASSLAFLGLNLATASVVTGATSVVGLGPAPLTPLLGGLLLGAGVVALLPPVVGRFAGLVAGGAGDLRLGVGSVLRLAALMAATWTAYAGAVVLLTPDRSPATLPAAAGAFALSYAVGVAVVVAPAGVGAREVTLVALLAPVVGVAAATAATVVARVLHTAADLLLALVAWLVARRGRAPDPVERHPTTGHPRAAERSPEGDADVVVPT